MAGTHEDAMLLMKIVNWASSIGLADAGRVIFNQDFDKDSADAMEPPIQTVLVVGETLGTFVKNDLLNRELVNDLYWIQGMWDRVGPAAQRAREQAGEARLYENFEALAAGA